MKFHSRAIEEHQEVPLPDEGRWESLVEHWSRREAPAKPVLGAENACYVLCVCEWREAHNRSARLSEILGLVNAQGDRVVGHEVYELVHPDPKTLIRRGVAEHIGARASDSGANLLVVDAHLSPSQTRNLEDATGLAVCDREAVILNVFERHARTRRARLQVEIAHLEYLRPRIRGIGLDMDQQAGGIMGSRGPGETASELLARRLDGRLAVLRKSLAQLRQADEAQRKHRDTCFRICLVGYTNAGKTSLMNALTSSNFSTRDQPFETLETTSRSLTRHGGDVLLSDTVGFIRRLPDRLFASFASTLAEIAEASLLVIVADVADPECEFHLHAAENLLTRLSSESIPRFYVFNKLDRLSSPLEPAVLEEWSRGFEHLTLSSSDPDAVEHLRRRLLASGRRKQKRKQVFVPYEATRITGDIYARCRVLAAKPAAHGMQFVIEGPAHVVATIARECKTERRQS